MKMLNVNLLGKGKFMKKNLVTIKNCLNFRDQERRFGEINTKKAFKMSIKNKKNPMNNLLD